MDTIEAFIKHNSLLNRSPHTIRSYASDVREFIDFISDKEKNLDNILLIHIRHYLSYLSMKELSKKSIARKLSSLKNFFEFLLKTGKIKTNPAITLRSPKIGRFLPSTLSREEFFKIIQVIDTRELAGKRDKAMISLLFSSGVRSEELLSIKDEDLHLKGKEVLVLGKGGKERIVFFDENAQQALLDYIPLKRAKFPESRYLFLNKFGEKLSSRFLRKVVSDHSASAGIHKEVTPHTFRHSFATLLMDKGVSLKLIQEFLGHASISSTQIYTHVSREELRKSYDKYVEF